MDSLLKQLFLLSPRNPEQTTTGSEVHTGFGNCTHSKALYAPAYDGKGKLNIDCLSIAAAMKNGVYRPEALASICLLSLGLATGALL